MSFTPGQNFLVEDGTGLANSTSYLSTDDANTYATTYNVPNWLALDVTLQQQYLMDATYCIDRLYGQDFLGIPMSHDYIQALLWPRFTVVVNGIQVVETGQLPYQLTQAVFEVACMDMNGLNLYPEPNRTPFLTGESKSIGSLRVQQTFGKPPLAEKFTGFWKVEQILYPLLKQTRNPTYLSL